MTGEQDSRRNRDEARRRAALRDLERAGEQSEVFLAGGAWRAAERVRDHFTAADAAGGGRIEVWGRRVGRIGSLIAFLFLAYYLAATYL